MNRRNLYEGSNETDCAVYYDCYYGGDPYKNQSPPPPALDIQSHPLSSYVVVIVTSLASFIFMVVLYFIIRRYCSRRQGLENRGADQEEEFLDENRGPGPGQGIDHHVWFINTVGLQPSVINSISVFRYKKGGNIVEGNDCSVCLSEFQEDETLRLLPKCSHAFHTHCIDTWLRSHTNCPLCRAKIVTNSNGDPPEMNNQEDGLTQYQIGENDDDEEEAEEEETELINWSSIRRSVSMDFGHSSIPKPSQAQEEDAISRNQGNRASAASISMKRSFSCGGRLVFTRNNRNPHSILPI